MKLPMRENISSVLEGEKREVKDFREYCEYCEDEREKKNKWWQINKGYLENKVHSLERKVSVCLCLFVCVDLSVAQQ